MMYGHSIGKLVVVPWVAGYGISCDGELARRERDIHQVLISPSFASLLSFISDSKHRRTVFTTF